MIKSFIGHPMCPECFAPLVAEEASSDSKVLVVITMCVTCKRRFVVDSDGDIQPLISTNN